MRRALLVAVVLVAAACATIRSNPHPPGPNAPAGPAPLLAAIEREPCFGFCPVCRAEVLAGGTLRYRGVRWVKLTGEHVDRLRPDQLDELADAFQAARFETFAPSDEQMHVTDLSTVTLTWRGHTVRHYHGDRTAPTSSPPSRTASTRSSRSSASSAPPPSARSSGASPATRASLKRPAALEAGRAGENRSTPSPRSPRAPRPVERRGRTPPAAGTSNGGE